MPYPELLVQVAFESEPLETGLEESDWTTLDTVDVQSLAIVRGKQEALDALQPGALTVMLDNSSRGYDPVFFQSTSIADYFKPGKRIRVVATYGEDTYTLYYGYVDGWPQSYMPPDSAVATLTATDAFKYVTRGEWASDPYRDIVMADSPWTYYRFNEKAGHIFKDEMQRYNGASDGYWLRDLKEVFSDPIHNGIGHSARLAEKPVISVGIIPNIAIRYLRPLTIEFWFKSSKHPVSDQEWGWILDAGGIQVKIAADDNATIPPGVLECVLSDDTNTVTVNTNTTKGYWDMCTGDPKHVQIYYDETGGIIIYINGVAASDSATYLPGHIPAFTPPTADVYINFRAGFTGDTFLDELAFYDHVIPGDHTPSGIEPWGFERTGYRVANVLEAINWTDYDVNEEGATTVGPMKDFDIRPVEYLDRVLTSEQGTLRVEHHDTGTVKFRSRVDPLTLPRSVEIQALFTDQPELVHTLDRSNPSFVSGRTSFAPIRFSDIEMSWDERQIINQVTIKWRGDDITVTDPELITGVDAILAKTFDTVLETNAEAQALADWLLDHYKNIFVRVKSVKVRPSAMQGTDADIAWKACLGLREGDRIRIELTPQNIPPIITFDALVEGIEHKVDNGRDLWETTFYCSPADIDKGYWLLGYGALDFTTRLSY